MKNAYKYIGAIIISALVFAVAVRILPEYSILELATRILPKGAALSLVKRLLSEDVITYANHMISPIIVLVAFWKVFGAYKHSEKYRLYVFCFLIATMMYLLGDIIWARYELTTGMSVPEGHISSAFYSTSSLFVVFSMAALIGIRRKKWHKFMVTVDAFVMGAFMLYVAFMGFFPAISPELSFKNLEVEELIIISEIVMDLILVVGIALICNSDSTYFKNKYGKLQFIGFLAWALPDLVRWYMEISNINYSSTVTDLIWPVSFLLIGMGIHGMEMEILNKPGFDDQTQDSGIKLITIPILLTFASTLIFKPIFEFIMFFLFLIIFRVILYRYIQVHEENFKISMRYKKTNEALEAKINDINNFNLNLEKNIVERTKELEIKNKELYSTANIDNLTKVPNRRNFMNHLDKMIESADGESRFAVLFLDLDRFKAINDWYGHDTGDMVLIDTTSRIRKIIGESGFLARLGGDEFVVILEKIKDMEDSLNRANQIIEEFRMAFVIDKKNIVSTISIGISAYPLNSRDRTELMKFADVALYRAKAEGKNKAVVYDAYMKEEDSRKLEIESRINEGFWKGELYLDYQPQVDVRSGKIVGVEALIRWESSELGEIGPKEFIGIAEANGLISEIGEFVIEEAFKTIRYINQKYNTNITMAINVSPKQFNETKIISNIGNMIKKNHINPGWVEIEITENLSIRNEEMVLAKLEELKSIGTAIVMDDFGTGYSSFSYLKKYPIDKLKIDKAFVMGLADNRDDYKIVKSIISMCKELGVLVIAEGVEKSEQVDILKQLECDIIQGYYYSKPVSLEELETKYFKPKAESKISHPRWDGAYDILS